jgi:2-polyprenyl-3-methyl-5-hydroxy-6-metoxy-1,4-benzoquinol methylase
MQNSNQTVAYSDEFWSKFERNAAKHPANLYRYDQIADQITQQVLKLGCIVDLGCGNGSLLKRLKGIFPKARLVGVDSSLQIISRNQLHADGIEYMQADLQDFKNHPLEGIADVVICSEVIEHMPLPYPTFGAAYAILRRGGLFILSTQGGKRRRHDIELLGHLQHFSLPELQDKVKEAGFVIDRAWACGWPVLDAQKVAASAFLGKVSEELASDKEPSVAFDVACALVGIGLRFSSKSKGPQLFVVARKP